MDRGAWRATVQRVAQSQTWLKWLSTRAIWKHGEGWLTFSSCPPPIVHLWNLAITLHLEHISVQTSPSSDACVAGGSSLGRHRSQSGLNTSGDRALTPSWTFTPSPQTLSWELPPGQPGRTQHHCLHFRAGWHPLQGINSPADMPRCPPPAPRCGQAPRGPTPAVVSAVFPSYWTKLRDFKCCPLITRPGCSRAGAPSQDTDAFPLCCKSTRGLVWHGFNGPPGPP